MRTSPRERGLEWGHVRMRVLSLAFLVFVLRASGGEVAHIPEIGAHLPILIVQKNVNPQNRMVIYTKADRAGRILTDPKNRDRPVFDFYWLMDGKSYKPVNRLIKTEIRKRFQCQSGASDGVSRFTVHMNDLKEVNADMVDPKMDVYVTEENGAQKVEARMTLGPSDGNMRIKLNSLYTEGRAFPPAVKSVTLQGEEVVDGVPTGNKVTRKYDAK
jgi:hypothetical protein